MTENAEAYDIKLISYKSRLIKTLAIAIPSISLGILVVLSVVNNGNLKEGFLLPLILVLVGFYFSWKAFTTKELKKLTGTKVSTINYAKRKKAKIVVGLGCLALLVTALVLYKLDTPLSEYVAMFVMVGITLGLYAFSNWSPEVVFELTPAATTEQHRLDKLNAIKAAEYQKKEADILDQWWFRYPLAVLLIVVAWWIEDVKPHAWWISVILVLMAIVNARELALWIIGLALVWAMIAGIAALPVAVAIIVGALIIASAINR